MRSKRDGRTKLPIYWVWRSMVDRCKLPTHQAWKNYGGRGIRVCKRWKDFTKFLSDMLPNYKLGLTLERKDNDKDYKPSNCTWITLKAQANNRQNSLKFEGLTIDQLQDKYKLKRSTIYYRIHHGVPLSQPLEYHDYNGN